MGYCIDQRDASFFISKDNLDSVLSAIHRLGHDYTNSHYYSWIDNDYTNYNDLKKVFNCWRWEICDDKEGNIIAIYFNGSKLGDDMVLFRAIAPYVKNDSYIEIMGEDGEFWRWVFKNGTCIEAVPEIIWKY